MYNESRLQPKIPYGHAVLTWLIRHSAILRTMRMRSADGASAWERVRGTPCSAKLLGFGELCRYKCRSHEGTIAAGATRLSSGVWLGVDLKIGQHMLWDTKLEY